MGHDITLGDSDSTYISFNWAGPFGSIFHISDIHGHDNEDGRISCRLKEALATLAGLGATPVMESQTDRWGCYLSTVDLAMVLEPGMEVAFHKNPEDTPGKYHVIGSDKDTRTLLVQFTSVESESNHADKDSESIGDTPVTQTVTMHTVSVDQLDASRIRATRHDLEVEFAHILSGFLQLAERHPDETWFSDQVWCAQELYGVMGLDRDE